MKIFRKPIRFEKPLERFAKAKILVNKSIRLLGKSLIFPFMSIVFWYFVLYRNDIHFSEHMEGMITAAWIPSIGILYSILAANAVGTVWTEYKDMRKSVKEYDVDTFMRLRDEELSPLVHILIGTISFFFLASFMSLKYPEWQGGATLIGSTAYILGLLFMIVREIDDPCAGLWYIKNIPEKWLCIDPKAWRAKMHKPKMEKFESENKDLLTVVVVEVIKRNPEPEKVAL